MKLYYAKGACSLVVRIVINELGLPCEYESVDLKTKQTEAGNDFSKINSKGAVPTLLTDESEILTENAVILQYLADKAKALTLLPPTSDFKHYRVLEWLNYITTELHKSFGPLFSPVYPAEVKENIVMPMLKKKFFYVNECLAKQGPFLLGDTLTLPDAYLFVMIRWTTNFKFDLNEWPHLCNFYESMKKQKAVQKSLQEEGLV